MVGRAPRPGFRAASYRGTSGTRAGSTDPGRTGRDPGRL